MIIGIIGSGFVGNSMKLLECKDIEILVYDIKKELCSPKNINMNDLLICDFIFICVPTPMKSDGSCHIDIVEKVVYDLNNIKYDGYIICKSTVPVNTCNKLNIRFCPEFLTEKNYKEDFINTENWIIGLLNTNNDLFQLKFTEMINLAYNNKVIKFNNIIYLKNNEAEMIKLFKNSYLATKVSFCNEIYQFCKKKQINYETVINTVTLDPRIEKSHTTVPGHDSNFGFGGTCFPKDIHNLKHQLDSVNSNSFILTSVIKRNEEIDRPKKDWLLDKNRVII